MEYKVEIVKYRTETTILTLTADEISEDCWEGVIDDLEDYKYAPSDVAMKLVQRLPNVKEFNFETDEHNTGLECMYEKIDSADTLPKLNI